VKNQLLKHLPKIEYLALLAIVWLAYVLRTIDFNQGFWEDECFEFNMSAARPFWGAFTFQPFPIYHISAHFALYLGDEEWTLRVPSLIFGLLGVIMLYVLTRKFCGRIMALLAALLLATSNYHIMSSSEARFYALTILAGLLILYTLERALSKGRKRDWAWFVLAGNFGVLSQMTVVPFLFAMAAGAALWFCMDKQFDTWAIRLKKIMLLTGCVFLSLTGTIFCNLVGEYNVFRTFSSDSNTVRELLVAGSHKYEVKHYKLEVMEYLKYFTNYFDNFSMLSGSVFIVLALLGLRFLYKKSSALACILTTSFIVTPIPFLILSTTHWYHSRYFCPLLPFVLLMVTGGLVYVMEGALSKIPQGIMVKRPVAISMLARGIVMGCFIVLFTPVIVKSLSDSSKRDFGYQFRDQKVATNSIRKYAQPGDMAMILKPRPDWEYYDRKVLASYLVEPVKRSEPFEIFYLSIANAIDINKLPSNAVYKKTLWNEKLDNNDIYRFEVTPQNLRTIPELSNFHVINMSTDVEIGKDSTESFALPNTISLKENKSTFRITSERVKVMPHRYVEWIVELNGPPQFGMLMNFYDDTGALLLSESRWMRDTGASRVYEISGIFGEDERVIAQREMHPSGIAPPMAPMEDDFPLKLSVVTPPCATYMEVELLVRGDTRAGDTYAVQSSMVQGDWGVDEGFVELSTPEQHNPLHSFDHWTMISENKSVEGSVYSATAEKSEEFHFDVLSNEAAFWFTSEQYPIGESKAVQVEVEFYGNLEAITPYVEFYDENGKNPDPRRLQKALDQVFQPNLPSMVIIPGENGWSTFRGTAWVPEDTQHVLVGFLQGHREERMEKGMQIKLRNPKLYVEGINPNL